MTPSEKVATPERFPRRFLWVILLLGLAIRLWVSQVRWIGPDEGAHLMDARLAMDGLVPFVDFGSRQPLYVYSMTLFSELVGSSLFSMRLLPALLSTATGYVVFRIGEALLSVRAALVAAIIFLFLPFSVLHSTETKTGPLTMLLCSLAVYCFVRGERRERSGIFFMTSGALVALAFYVRQSSLAVGATLGIALIVRYWRSPGRMLRHAASLVGGFMAVSGAVAAFYLRMLPAGEFWRSHLNPITFVADNLGRVARVAIRSDATSSNETSPISIPEVTSTDQASPTSLPDEERSDQPWNETLAWLSLTGSLNVFLVLGGSLAGFMWLGSARTGPTNRGPPLILLLWTVTLAVAYALYTVERGFFPAYFSELVPPLALLTSFAAVWSLEQLESRHARSRGLVIIGILGSVFFLVEKVVNVPTLHQPFYFVVPTIALALSYLYAPEQRWRVGILSAIGVAGVAGLVIALAVSVGSWPKLVLYLSLVPVTYGLLFALGRIRPFARTSTAAAFLVLSLLVSSWASSLDRQAKALDLSFANLWTPAALKQAADYLRTNGTPNDRVISGAVIWEYQAGMHPFLNRSHPLAFQIGIPPDLRDSMEVQLQVDPPRFIVLDGYTERTYLRHLPGLGTLLSNRYTREVSITGPRFPVKIYRLRGSTPQVQGPP